MRLDSGAAGYWRPPTVAFLGSPPPRHPRDALRKKDPCLETIPCPDGDDSADSTLASSHRPPGSLRIYKGERLPFEAGVTSSGSEVEIRSSSLAALGKQPGDPASIGYPYTEGRAFRRPSGAWSLISWRLLAPTQKLLRLTGAALISILAHARCHARRAPSLRSPSRE